MWLTNIFSHPIGCLFILLMISFAGQKVFSLMWPHLFLLLLPLLLVSNTKSHCQEPLWKFTLCIFSRSFVVLGFMFKSLIHVQLIFVYNVRQGSNFFLLRVTICMDQMDVSPLFGEEPILSPWHIIGSLVENQLTEYP